MLIPVDCSVRVYPKGPPEDETATVNSASQELGQEVGEPL